MMPMVAASRRTAARPGPACCCEASSPCARAIGVETVEREREDRDRFVAVVLGHGGEIGFGDLADEQAGRFVDPQRGAPVAPARHESQQFALARLAAVELGLELERRAHARDQLDAVDRLGDVVGGAGDEGVGQAVHVVERRHHDDGEIDVARIVADARAGLDAVHLRHDDVEQHEVDGGRARRWRARRRESRAPPSRACRDHIVVAGRQQRPFGQIAGIFGSSTTRIRIEPPYLYLYSVSMIHWHINLRYASLADRANNRQVVFW